jgi:hypothetical protein
MRISRSDFLVTSGAVLAGTMISTIKRELL